MQTVFAVLTVFAGVASLACAHPRPTSNSPVAASPSIAIVEQPRTVLGSTDGSDRLIFVTRSVVRPEVPISDVSITVRPVGPEIAGRPGRTWAATNADGVASIAHSYVGEIEVTAHRVGYQQLSFHVALAVHCRQTLELYMGPAPVTLAVFPAPSAPPTAEPRGRVVFTTCAPT